MSSSRRASPVLIGAFVVGGIAILVAAVLLVGTGRLFRRTQTFVSYFEGSVHGLRAGSSVKFKGVELGQVTRIRIPFWIEGSDPPIAVFYALEEDALAEVDREQTPSPDDMRRAVERGLRAQLETDSVVTNVKYIALSIEPGSAARLHPAIAGVMEIPTIPATLQELGATVYTLADRLARYDFEGLLDGVKAAAEGIGELVRSPEVRELLASSEQLVADLDRLVLQLEPVVPELVAATEGAGELLDEIRARISPLAESLEGSSARVREAAAAVQATADSTRVLLDPEAPLTIELRAGLRELSETARTARSLIELLERDPSVLLRGRSEPSSKER